MTAWKEVRRGTPAEHITGIPADSMDWAVWTRGDQTVTVYQTELRDEMGEEMRGPIGSERKAMNIAEELKTNAFIGI